MKKIFAILAILVFISFPVFATVSDTETPIKVYTSGTATEYPITFDYIDDEDVVVTLVNISTGAETAQTLDVDYTIASDTVTYSTAPGSSYYVVLRRETPYTQEASFTEGEAPPLTTYESAFDKLTYLAQDLNERLGRAPLLPEDSSVSNPTMPDPARYPGQYVRINSGGSDYEAVDLSGSGITINLGVLSDYADFNTMVSTIGATEKTIYVDTVGTLTANASIPSTLHLVFLKGGSVTLGNYDLAFANQPEIPASGKVFNYTGTGVVTGLSESRPEWWGGATSSADNSTALQCALTAISATGGKCVVGPGTWKYGAGLVWTGNNTQLEVQGTLAYTGTDAGVALTIGEDASQTNELRGRIKLVDDNGSIWTTAKVGIDAINLYSANIEMSIGGQGTSGDGGFATGLRISGTTSNGNSYNKYFLDKMLENKIGILFYTASSGWVNENNFYGGRFSAFLTHSGEWADSYHIKIDYGNSNKFWGPSFEHGNYYCYFYNNAPYNSLYSPRMEGSPTYRVLNDSTGDYFRYFSGYSTVTPTPEYGFVDLSGTSWFHGRSVTPLGSRSNRIYDSINTTPTAGTHRAGDLLRHIYPAYGNVVIGVCTASGTYSSATDATGSTDGSTAVITGMTDTSDFYVGEFVTVSAGMPYATAPHQILAKTSSSVTLDANSTSAQSGVTVSTVDPVWADIGYAMTSNTEQSVSYAAAIDIDLSLGDVILVGKLGGNIRLNNPTNAKVGQRFFVVLTCDGSGRTISYDTSYQAGTKSITANKKIVLEFVVLEATKFRQIGTPIEI